MVCEPDEMVAIWKDYEELFNDDWQEKQEEEEILRSLKTNNIRRGGINRKGMIFNNDHQRMTFADSKSNIKQ